MSEKHAFWQLIEGATKSDLEKVVISAVCVISTDVETRLTPEQIYDKLLAEFEQRFADGPRNTRDFLSVILDRIHRMEQSIRIQLQRMEDTLTAQSTALSRLQTISDGLKSKLTSLATAADAAAAAQAESNAALLKDIADLRAAIGSGDETALNAVADSLDSTQAGFADVQTKLEAFAKAEVDSEATGNPPPPPPPPPPTATIAVNPATANITPGGTQQFAAVSPTDGTPVTGATWAATSGTVDANGLYTGPTDLALTSDVVTATNPADGSTATANVTIG